LRVEKSNQSRGDELAAIVDQAIDAVHTGTLRRDLTHVDFGRVVGTKDHRLDPRTRRIGGGCRARIAVGRHRDRRDAQFPGHRNRHHQPARLKRSGGEAPFVLDQQACRARFARQSVERDQRRRILAQADDIRFVSHRQQFAVAPQIGGPRRQRIARHRLRRGSEVIAHQQGTPDTRQAMQPIGLIPLPGHRTFEMRHECRAIGGQIVVVHGDSFAIAHRP
jgi:hypothetical protein